MAVSRAFIDYVGELFASLGPIRTKRMFGAVGVYADEVFFAVIDDDTLYLRVDDETADRFRDAGSEPFTFTMKDGREVAISYWRAPEEALEDPEAALDWGRLALAAAVRKHAAKAARRKP